MATEYETEESAEDIALSIINDIIDREKRPVDSEELAELNATHNFVGEDVSSLFLKLGEIEARYHEAIDSGSSDAIDAFFSSADSSWRSAFDRYKKTDEWKSRLNHWIAEQKKLHSGKSANFNRGAKVVKEIDADRSYIPAIGAVGRIVDGEFEYWPSNPSNSKYMYQIQFPLPCSLVGNGMYVNESIVTEEESSEYIKEHQLSFVVWQRDDLDYCTAYFAEDEIEIVS